MTRPCRAKKGVTEGYISIVEPPPPGLEQFADDSLRFMDPNFTALEEEIQGANQRNQHDSGLADYLTCQNNESSREAPPAEEHRSIRHHQPLQYNHSMLYRDVPESSSSRASRLSHLYNPARITPAYPKSEAISSRMRRLSSLPSHHWRATDLPSVSNVSKVLSTVVERTSPDQSNHTLSVHDRIPSYMDSSISDDSKLLKHDVQEEILARKKSLTECKTEAVTRRRKTDVTEQIKAISQSFGESEQDYIIKQVISEKGMPNSLLTSHHSIRHEMPENSQLRTTMMKTTTDLLNKSYDSAKQIQKKYLNLQRPTINTPINQSYVHPNRPASLQASYIQPTQPSASHVYDNLASPSPSLHHSQHTRPNNMYIANDSLQYKPTTNSPLLDSFDGTTCSAYHSYLRSRKAEHRSSPQQFQANRSTLSPQHYQSDRYFNSTPLQSEGIRKPLRSFSNGYTILDRSPVVNDTHNTTSNNRTLRNGRDVTPYPHGVTSYGISHEEDDLVLEITTNPVIINNVPPQFGRALSNVVQTFSGRANELMQRNKDKFAEDVNDIINNSLNNLLNDINETSACNEKK